jgi:hypothetical protein
VPGARSDGEFPAIPRDFGGWTSSIRTGDGGVGALKAQWPAFISVAKLGGSDSLSIRLNEGLGSANQYCKYEFHSLRG